MGDRRQAGKPYWYVTSHPRQLSLAIPPWVSAMNITVPTALLELPTNLFTEYHIRGKSREKTTTIFSVACYAIGEYPSLFSKSASRPELVLHSIT